jgi:siroheme synthase (precorrin-2 oxidase/ferrochelatase)
MEESGTLAAEGDGTRLDIAIVTRMIGPLVARRARRRTEEALQMLKSICEARAS